MRNAVCADIRLHFGGNATCVACVVGGFGKRGEREGWVETVLDSGGLIVGWNDSRIRGSARKRGFKASIQGEMILF